MSDLNPLRRANWIATRDLWPRINKALAAGPIEAGALAKMNKFVPQYAQIIAHEEDGDVTAGERLSWDSQFEKHLKALKGEA